jgi:DNA (cytosine-5)-methyltransferase 1
MLGEKSMNEQLLLWSYIYPPFKFPKGHKVKMFEAFSGIGCQAMALKRVTNDYELVGFSEIDKYAIQSYHAIHGDIPNYGDIKLMKSIPECDIFTYSFPCTDLSKAGRQAGLDGGTRSGLVREVLRLLRDGFRPPILIMENVVDLVQDKFVKQFNEIQRELESYGYKNYNEVLNAKDYGIPQNRERIFMVSIEEIIHMSSLERFH